MTYPITPNLTVYFTDGATFGYGNFVLDDFKNGVLGTSTLANSATGDLVVDVSTNFKQAKPPLELLILTEIGTQPIPLPLIMAI
jgi:hypothetical protein